MENKKKMIFNVLFLFLVFAATLYGVFHGEDLSEIAEILKTVNLYWLLPGVACVIIFIWGESIIIFYMMHTLGIHLKKWKCFLFSSVGFFFSCITPSATGGQPAQIYYMKKEKIPIPVSTLVLMIVTITYKMVLVVIGLGLMIFGRGFIRTHMYNIRHIFYLGTGLNVFCVASMLLLVFHPVLARSILVKGMELLEKMHLMRYKSTRIEKLNASMDQYHTTAVYLKDHIMVLVNVFAIAIYMILIYLLSKIIIEKNAQSISMVKILGYTNGEISKLYIMSTSLVVVFCLLLSLPLETVIMKVLFREMMLSSISGWITLWIDPMIYVQMFAAGIITYGIVALLEFRRVKKVPMDEALKNVE